MSFPVRASLSTQKLLNSKTISMWSMGNFDEQFDKKKKKVSVSNGTVVVNFKKWQRKLVEIVHENTIS